jgi:hypothetical protein
MQIKFTVEMQAQCTSFVDSLKAHDSRWFIIGILFWTLHIVWDIFVYAQASKGCIVFCYLA